MAISKILGILCGILCCNLAAKEMPEATCVADPLFWTIFLNRVLIGVTVGLAGFVDRCYFCFKFCPMNFFWSRIFLRGAGIGAFVSLPNAFGILIGADFSDEKIKFGFWATIAAGAFYGFLIDLIATKFAGEGKKLFDEKNCEKK